MNPKKVTDDLKYENFWFENQKWYGYRICPRCNEDVLCYAQKKYLLFRNIRNKTKKGCLCRKCQSEFYFGEKNPFYGKKHTEESVKKISNSRKGKCTGDCNHMRNLNSSGRKKTLEGHKNFYKDLKKSAEARKKQSETIRNNIRLGKMKTQNKSKKENEIKDFITNSGYDVIQYFRVDTKICDFYLPKQNLIIEYNGDYWHCNPIKYEANYFNHKKG